MSLIQKFAPSSFIGSIKSQAVSPFRALHTYIIVALITPLAMYYGSTEVGWSFGSSKNYLDPVTAFQICLLSFFSIIGLTAFIGFLTKWMSKTFGSNCTYFEAFSLIAYATTPLLMSGIIAVYPNISLGISFFFLGLAASVWLLFKSTPTMMGISNEQGFIFAATICTVSMVAFVSLIAVSVVLWDTVFILTTH